MDNISLRECRKGDEAVLALVGQASFLEAFASILSGRDIVAHCLHQHSIAKYASWLGDEQTTVWLAETEPGNAPVGYLVLTKPDLPLPDISETDAEIKRVYLLHRFQGGGIGARLMLAAKNHAMARGKSRLLLGVYGGNAAAISFYEKLGYRCVGTRKFRVGENTYDDLILGLTL